MITAFGAWLFTLIEKVGLQWLWDTLVSAIKSFFNVIATHRADADQSQQDMNKLENLPPNATAEQESDAGNDALKHL